MHGPEWSDSALVSRLPRLCIRTVLCSSAFPSVPASLADLLIIPTLAAAGILMAPMPLPVIADVFAPAIVLAFVLDLVKVAIFRRLRIV